MNERHHGTVETHTQPARGRAIVGGRGCAAGKAEGVMLEGGVVWAWQARRIGQSEKTEGALLNVQGEPHLGCLQAVNLEAWTDSRESSRAGSTL